MSINPGLSVSDVVSVSVSLATSAAQQRNFGSLLILGDSGVIDTTTRYRQYSSLAAVLQDFGSSAPEAVAAGLYFGQTPSPSVLYIGAWARAATSASLIGGILSAAQQAIANFTAVGAAGSLSITINGTVKNLTGINLTSVTNLNGVAAAITTALAGAGTCVWNSVYGYFQITSSTTGATSLITFATTTAGTDISALMLLQSTQSGYVTQGINQETPAAAVSLFAGLTNAWYGLMFAAATPPATADYLAVAGIIQGLSPTHIFGITTQDSSTLNPGTNTDLASQMQALNYNRTFLQYSSSNAYACAELFGVAFTVNFSGALTTLTLKFQNPAGVAAETLTETQASALTAKNCNVRVNYNNATAIIQQGVMSSGTFFDVIHGADWLQNALQTAVYNVLYTAGTKIPQTDAGVSQLVAACASVCQQAVVNGYLAPGVWFGPTLGAIVYGQMLSNGYYIYAPPVATQSQSARAARQAPVIQIAGKLAGAIHSASVLANVLS